MQAGMPSDEVTDAIAHIEMHRQETQKESGLAASCSDALRKLHLLLEEERANQQAQPPGSGNPANIEAVTAAIQKTRNLASGGNKSPRGKEGRHGHPPQPGGHPRGPHNAPRHKGRRRPGRRGGGGGGGAGIGGGGGGASR